jgi:hypothetical protein
LAYDATKGNHDLVVVDDEEVSSHKEILDRKLVFETPNNLHHLARDNGGFSLHEIVLSSSQHEST